MKKKCQKIYEDKISVIGPYSLELFNQVVARQPKHWARTVKGIISLTKLYSNDTVEAACKRALAYGISEYQTVKRICKNAAYTLPLEEVAL